MTWRLVIGVVVMQRRSLLSTIVLVGLFSRPTGFPDWLWGGLAMVLTAGAGATAHSALAQREIAVLPASPREQHRAGWILSALLPLGLLTVARGLGGALHAWMSDGGWVFHASAALVMFEIVYFSLIAAWAVRTPERYEPDYRQDPRFLSMLAGMVAVIAIPFLAIPWLPRSVDDISVALWICALVALGVGLAPLMREPVAYQRPSTPLPAASHEHPAPLAAGTKAVTARRSPFRVAGMWVPMRDVAVRALAWTVAMVAFLVFAQYDKSPVTIWGPFDSSITELWFLTTIGTPMLMLLGVCPGLGAWIGALKRLPVSSRSAALLLSLAPATMPVLFWAALLVIHLVASAQSPDALRLGQLTLFVGLVALVDALGTKSGSFTAKLAIGAPVLVAFLYGMDTNRALVAAVLEHWALPLAGLLCLGLSWLINLHTLTRSPASSRAFRFGWPHQRLGAR